MDEEFLEDVTYSHSEKQSVVYLPSGAKNVYFKNGGQYTREYICLDAEDNLLEEKRLDAPGSLTGFINLYDENTGEVTGRMSTIFNPVQLTELCFHTYADDENHKTELQRKYVYNEDGSFKKLTEYNEEIICKDIFFKNLVNIETHYVDEEKRIVCFEGIENDYLFRNATHDEKMWDCPIGFEFEGVGSSDSLLKKARIIEIFETESSEIFSSFDKNGKFLFCQVYIHDTENEKDLFCIHVENPAEDEAGGITVVYDMTSKEMLTPRKVDEVPVNTALSPIALAIFQHNNDITRKKGLAPSLWM